MLSKDKIERINFLAKKQKNEGLTPGEQREQQLLRSEYLKAVRGQVKQTLDRTKIVDGQGKEILVKHSYKHKNCGCNHHNHDSGCKHIH